MKRKILLSGGGGAGSEAIFRILGNMYDLYFADSVIGNINPSIPEDRTIAFPWANEPNFTSIVQDICDKNSIDLLIPGVDEELLSLAKYFNKSRTQLLLPSVNFIETMLDKLVMSRSFLAKNISTPFSLAFDQDLSNLNFPCICKPRSGRGSRDITYLTSLREAFLFRDFLSFSKDPHLFIIQELAKGVEYTVQMIADKNSLLKSIVPVEISLKRGITIDARISNNPIVVRACREIHKYFPTPGIYNIQLILTEDGLVYPFEINPRVSTTFCLALAAGLEPLKLYFDDFYDPDAVLNFTDDFRIQRFWCNIITP